MVRLMCQNFICQDGGDTVDQKRAEKAVTALLKTEDKTTFQTFFSETDSGTSSDSTTHEVARDGESDTDEERLIIEIKEEAIRTGQTESEVRKRKYFLSLGFSGQRAHPFMELLSWLMHI